MPRALEMSPAKLDDKEVPDLATFDCDVAAVYGNARLKLRLALPADDCSTAGNQWYLTIDTNTCFNKPFQ